MSRNLRILIIEDDPEWVKAIKGNFLEVFNELRIPCTIEIPKSLHECKNLIRCASEAPYDLISLDVHLHQGGSWGSASGLDLLRDVTAYKAAWMVSILTGVEEDQTVVTTYGDTQAQRLQKELRSRAFMTFPPERLLVMEKPPLNDVRLVDRLRQICIILRHSLARRNIFRPLDLDCQVAVHETRTGEWIRRDSPEFRRAKRAYEFVKQYEKDANEEQRAKYEEEKKTTYKAEKKCDILARNTTGSRPRLKDAKWIEDVVSLRQIRFECGEVITLPDNPNFKTIAWLLERPGKEFTAPQIGGESAEIERESVPFKYSSSPEGGIISQSFDDNNNEEHGWPDSEDDDTINNSRDCDRDYESKRSTGEGVEVDTTEAESYRVYAKELKRKKAELEAASGSRSLLLKEQIEALENELAKVRRKPVGGNNHDTIKQHKSRAIAALKEAGQIELAEHLEKTITVNGFRFSYNVESNEYLWNT